jgi:hypothetical protein
MKKFHPLMSSFLAVVVLVIGISVWTSERVRAGIVCTLPVNLQNNTIADATQVMANFNALVACFLNNIAASGANNDITGLFALTTPIAPVNGGTPIYQGSNSTGSSTVQVIGTTVPGNFVLTSGRSVLFTAGVTNSGPLTMNVAASGAVNVFRRTAVGIVALVGGEVVANNVYLITYDGAQWQLTTPSLPKTPTVQVFLSGSGSTYTTPAGATWIEVKFVGGGGGGSSSTAGTAATAGTDSIFNGVHAVGGALASAGVAGAGGGFGGGCTAGAVGGAGGSSAESFISNLVGSGGAGGSSFYGGGGPGGTGAVGIAAVANSGGGGGGGGHSTATSQIGGGGGGGGGYCWLLIPNPAATYIFTIGAGGNGGDGGGAFAGGNGGTGYMIVVEHYGS